MFDALGILSFLVIIVCIGILIASVFNRRINIKKCLIVLAAALAVFFTSYAIDVNVIEKNKKPTEIDFTGIEIEPPAPSPTPEPLPPTPSPEPEEEEEAEETTETEEETEDVE